MKAYYTDVVVGVKDNSGSVAATKTHGRGGLVEPLSERCLLEAFLLSSSEVE